MADIWHSVEAISPRDLPSVSACVPCMTHSTDTQRVMQRASLKPKGDEPAEWNRADRQELAVLAVYFLFVVAATDALNVRLGVELMTVVTLVAALTITRQAALFLKDWWFFLAALIIWNLGGPIGHTPHFPLHLDFLRNLDRLMFFGNDAVVIVQQHLATGTSVNTLDVLTAIAYNMHLPEPYIAGYFLWRLDRALYLQFAAAAQILLVLGFITFILFPAVPPWMAATWYHVTPGVTDRFGPVLRAHPMPFHGTPLFSIFRFPGGDAVAAFPSEHAAFPLLEFLALSRLRMRWLSGLLLAWVLIVLFTVVYLGKHWITDALAGYVYALLIFGFVRWFATRSTRPAEERGLRRLRQA